jgi:hypothetical protein
MTDYMEIAKTTIPQSPAAIRRSLKAEIDTWPESVLFAMWQLVSFEKQKSKPATVASHDNGTLEYLFRGYHDDGIREPLIDFGPAVGNEQW